MLHDSQKPSFFNDKRFCNTIFVLALQSIVAQINDIIGAEGIASLECQTVMTNYGNLIWEFLIAGVGILWISCP